MQLRTPIKERWKIVLGAGAVLVGIGPFTRCPCNAIGDAPRLPPQSKQTSEVNNTKRSCPPTPSPHRHSLPSFSQREYKSFFHVPHTPFHTYGIQRGRATETHPQYSNTPSSFRTTVGSPTVNIVHLTSNIYPC